MPKAKLPVGFQNFEEIILEGYTYVDKTEIIHQLITRGKPYFLSRPRRFGKSLLLSTIHALFSGKRDLFKGLWIDNSDWNWMEYPVIQLDMSGINNETPAIFKLDLIRTLNEIAAEHNVTLKGVSPANYLENLIKKLHVKGKVVVLIDEYDKPLLDNISNMEVAQANCEILRQFYTILKVEDRHLKFIFMTGVTKFAKVSVFSGLNNLEDITMSNDYSTLLGYTRTELERNFAENIQDVANANEMSITDCYDRLKEWYNGYKFSKNGEPVYNPFSTLMLLKSKDFSTYWFETGTPTFLIDLMKKREFDLANLEQINASIQSFSTFDIEDLPTIPLFYQTGYLTIKSFLPHINAYCLGFPNREVSQSFSESLITSFASSRADCNKFLFDISTNLYAESWDYAQFFEIMEKLFALIPYDLYVKHERYFHSLFYLSIKLAGFQIGAEIHTQQGRTDAALEAKDKVIIFEFKFNKTSQEAMDQIKQKKYFQIYQDRKLPIYLVGINFNGEKRVIEGWQVEQI
jgi:hypothetical protein